MDLTRPEVHMCKQVIESSCLDHNFGGVHIWHPPRSLLGKGWMPLSRDWLPMHWLWQPR